MTHGPWLICAAILGALAVALGAFGAHALQGRVGSDMLEIWRTASLYHLVHALALLGTALVPKAPAPRLRTWAGALFTAGIVLFSGSLYLLALTGVKALGAVTPFGGVAFIAGWICLAAAGFAARRS